MFKQILKIALKGILAGIAISIGGFLFIKTKEHTGNHVLASFLFSIGLIFVCNFQYFLYTGKICYLIDEWKNKEQLNYGIQLLFGYFGNLIGALIVALSVKYTISMPDFVKTMITSKATDNWYSLIVKGAFCGILIFIAVEGFKKIDNSLGKYIVLFLCVGGFIISGYEHSIADAFYFFLGNDILSTIPALLLITLGNTIGGLIFPAIYLLIKKLD